MTFDSIKSDVENSYPMPLARVVRKYRITSEEDLGGRHKELIDVFEMLIKFLCVVQLQEARQHISGFRHYLPQGEKTLQFLRHPSLGSWVGLLRILCHLELERSDMRWFQQISRWYRQGKQAENTEILHVFEQIGGVQYESRTRHPHAEICNGFVNYRNKQFAHSSRLNEQELLKRLPLLEKILAYLLHSMDFLNTMHPVCTERIELNPDDSWRVHTVGLRGINEEPSIFRCRINWNYPKSISCPAKLTRTAESPCI